MKSLTALLFILDRVCILFIEPGLIGGVELESISEHKTFERTSNNEKSIILRVHVSFYTNRI